MYRAGVFNQPKNNDPEFNTLYEAEQWCIEVGKNDSNEAYAVWDKYDQTVYLYFDHEEFVPR